MPVGIGIEEDAAAAPLSDVIGKTGNNHARDVGHSTDGVSRAWAPSQETLKKSVTGILSPRSPLRVTLLFLPTGRVDAAKKASRPGDDQLSHESVISAEAVTGPLALGPWKAFEPSE